MAVEAEEAFTAAVVVADFTVVAAGFTAEEDSPAGTLDLVAATRSAVIMAAATEVVATTAGAGTTVAAVMDGAAEATAGAMDGAEAAGVGAGDTAGAGLIGDMDGAIRMATTAIRITRPPIRILPTDIQRIT